MIASLFPVNCNMRQYETNRILTWHWEISIWIWTGEKFSFKKKSCALFTFCKYETKNTKNVKKRRKKKGYDFKVQSCNNIHYFCDYETYTSLYFVVFSCSLNFVLFYFILWHRWFSLYYIVYLVIYILPFTVWNIWKRFHDITVSFCVKL